MRSGLLLVVLAFSLVSAPAAPSRAEPSGERTEDRRQAAARSRGEEGLQLFQAGKWAESYDAFNQADRLYHAPTLILFMARCRRNQGKLLEARALYDKVIAEPVRAGAPEQFFKAVAAAREELVDLQKRIPSVRVTLHGTMAAQARIAIDGAPLSEAERASGKALDPGAHEILAAVDKGASARKTILLTQGEAAWVELTLESPLSFGADAPPARWQVPAILAVGIGGAGVGVGSVAGILALSKISDIKSRCQPDGHCFKSDQPEADQAQTMVTLSTIGFVVGGVGLATGVALWFLRPGAAKAKKASTHVEVGLGSVTVGGRF
jgi:hypothetical protein